MLTSEEILKIQYNIDISVCPLCGKDEMTDEGVCFECWEEKILPDK